MDSMVVVDDAREWAIVWKPGTSTFNWRRVTRDDMFPEDVWETTLQIDTVDQEAFTFYGDDKGNPPTPEQAAAKMAERITDSPSNILDQ